MVDKIEKWWKMPPEFTELVENSRKGFRAQFGSFEEALIESYGLGTSEDGKYLAFQFGRPDGTIQRFTIRSEWVPQFIIELGGATGEMNERRLAAALTVAEPKGQA